MGDVTRNSSSPVLARTNPREKHVFPAPKSPPNRMVSPAVVPMDNMAPTSSMSSGVGTDNLSVYASFLSLSAARIFGSSGPNVEIESVDCASLVVNDTVLDSIVLVLVAGLPSPKARQPEEDFMR